MLIASKSLLRFSSTDPRGVEAQALTGGSRGVALGRIKRLPARDVLETGGVPFAMTGGVRSAEVVPCRGGGDVGSLFVVSCCAETFGRCSTGSAS
jgi:hypothetical protein